MEDGIWVPCVTMSEKPKILVVDDEAGMRVTLKAILMKKGYSVSVAVSGEQALEEAKKTEYQLILMDIKMSGMSGVEAFIRMKTINPKATVIMMTAYALEEETKKAIQEGAYAIVHKPFDMERFLAVIVECLKKQNIILVVDDREDDRSVIKALLEEKGFKVVDVESGEECINQVKLRRYQVILLDIRLPGISGVETLKQVKEIRPDVGVIMISAYDEKSLIEESLRRGSFTCLQKPLNIDNLLGVVNQCMGNPSGELEGSD